MWPTRMAGPTRCWRPGCCCWRWRPHRKMSRWRSPRCFRRSSPGIPRQTACRREEALRGVRILSWLRLTLGERSGRDGGVGRCIRGVCTRRHGAWVCRRKNRDRPEGDPCGPVPATSPAALLRQQGHHFSGVGVTPRLELAVDELPIHGDIIDAAAALDELGVHAVRVLDFRCETRSARLVASGSAIRDGDFHGGSVPGPPGKPAAAGHPWVPRRALGWLFGGTHQQEMGERLWPGARFRLHSARLQGCALHLHRSSPLLPQGRLAVRCGLMGGG